MLMEISNLITPEIYEVIYRMGHMDELVIADANYLASAVSKKVVYGYGPSNHLLLAELLKYFPLDDDSEFPINVMTPDHGYSHDPGIWNDYREILSRLTDRKEIELNKISRSDFYQRTRNAYATIQTSDPRLYADIIITKGVVLQD
jgi:L-fucose mutarotase